MAMSGLSRVRTELFHLLVSHSCASSSKGERQFSRHVHLAIFRPRRMVRWTYLLAIPEPTHRHLRRFHHRKRIESSLFVICPSRRRFPLESPT